MLELSNYVGRDVDGGGELSVQTDFRTLSWGTPGKCFGVCFLVGNPYT